MTYLNFVDVNECDLKTYTCDPNAECENIVGSYYCICNAGYTGSGKSCTRQYQKLITYHLAHISYLYVHTNVLSISVFVLSSTYEIWIMKIDITPVLKILNPTSCISPPETLSIIILILYTLHFAFWSTYTISILK